MAEIRIGQEAEAEYTISLRWYSARSQRAAEGFETAFASVIGQIGQFPERFPTSDVEGFRYAVLSGYPYSLIYRITETVVDVVALAHARRRPGYWAKRS